VKTLTPSRFADADTVIAEPGDFLDDEFGACGVAAVISGRRLRGQQ
jgi:hypothetical protein